MLADQEFIFYDGAGGAAKAPPNPNRFPKGTFALAVDPRTTSGGLQPTSIPGRLMSVTGQKKRPWYLVSRLTQCVPTPYEHCGCFYYGDLDGSPPLLPLKSRHLSLKLILSGLILLNLTLRLWYRHLGWKWILY